MRAPAGPVELHIVSDSTGETAARLVQALEAQFPDQEFEEVRHPRVETVDDLALAVNRAKGRPGGDGLHARRGRAPRVDADALPPRARALLRPARAPDRLDREGLGHDGAMTPGARPALNSAYFKRMEAIEFAVKYDDGVGRGLEEADIVLVGVSRTSKTPLSIYLGYLGHKAANVPIVKGIEPPPELYEIEPTKIVGLTIGADRLAEIRTARVRQWARPTGATRSSTEIYDELGRRPRSTGGWAAR